MQQEETVQKEIAQNAPQTAPQTGPQAGPQAGLQTGPQTGIAKIEHVNLVVTAIDDTARFLLAAFPHWRQRGEGGGEWAGVPRRWVHIGDDDAYITLNEFLIDNLARGGQRDLQSTQPGLAHIGFQVDNLDVIVSRLKKSGYESHNSGETHPHRRNCYYIDNEGLEFEFVEYQSDIPAQKNLYQ